MIYTVAVVEAFIGGYYTHKDVVTAGVPETSKRFPEPPPPGTADRYPEQASKVRTLQEADPPSRDLALPLLEEGVNTSGVVTVTGAL